MENVYLKTGEKCKLVKKIDDKYLVNPYCEYTNYDGDFYEELGDNVRLVNEILSEPPRAKISEEYQELLRSIEKKTALLRSISLEVEQCKHDRDCINKSNNELKKWKVDLSKYKEANLLVFFNEKSGELITTNPKDYKEGGYNLIFDINVFNGETNHYGLTLDYEGRKKSYGHESIDLEFGILINPTHQDIIDFVHKRYKQTISNPDDFNNYDISNIYDVPEKYQPAELKDAIKEREIVNKKAKVENKKEEIEHYKKELLKIENEYKELIK